MNNVANLSPLLSSFATLLSGARTNEGHDHCSDSKFALKSMMSQSCEVSVPSLLIRNKISSSSTNVPLEEVAALNLALPLYHLEDDISSVPGSLCKNVSTSFTTLIESRLRYSILALLKKSLSGSSLDEHNTKVIMDLLASSSAIFWSAVVTSFQVIPVPERNDVGGITFPILFETIVDLSVLGTQITITLTSPGTISGSTCEAENILNHVSIELDTITLLQSMMKQARYVVRKAVALATEISSILVAQVDSVSSLSSPTIVKSRALSMPPPPPRSRQSYDAPSIRSKAKSNLSCGNLLSGRALRKNGEVKKDNSNAIFNLKRSVISGKKDVSQSGYEKLERLVDVTKADSENIHLPHKKRKVFSCNDLSGTFSI